LSKVGGVQSSKALRAGPVSVEKLELAAVLAHQCSLHPPSLDGVRLVDYGGDYMGVACDSCL
jgi:hypothetical protein